MSPQLRSRVGLGTRVLVAVVVCGGALAFARKEAGGADPMRLPPHAGEPSKTNPSAIGSLAPSAITNAAPAREVEVRLIERLADAKIDAPHMTAGEYRLGAHWRKMQVPWTTLPPEAARYATSIALTASADEETQWSAPQANGTTWSPNAKIWNMNEGAYDMRQAIFAPTPATFSFRVTIPPDATLEFSPAVADWRKVDTGEPMPHSPKEATFAVLVDDGHGATPACEKTVSLAEDHGWQDASCDLSKWAGRDVELRLETSSPNKELASLALWGNPTLLAKRQTRVPFNILWVVVDAMRPDILPSFHDDASDAKTRHARFDPGLALLPKVPGLMPTLDDLASKGVRFTQAHSNAPWTRPGTLAMLSGERSTELGIDTTTWIVPELEAQRYYTTSPPMLPLLMRAQGMVTNAFVNNFFMAGYAQVGVDMGFERLDDHRQRTLDTKEITESSVNWLKSHADERFFMFCNFNSPHEPWEPPKRFADRVPDPPVGPEDWSARQYMAEAAKDDDAIGTLLHTLDDLKLRDHTIIVVTADHGETLSESHQGRLKLDNMNMRFHHAMGNYEETTRIPIVISLPGVLPDNANVTDRVRIIDIAPTLLELEGMPPAPKMSGKSLLPLIHGAHEPDERVTLSEGRDTRAILSGKWHFIEREGDAQEITIDGETKTVPYELYDLETDPGETHDVSKDRHDIVNEMMARIQAAQANVAVADSVAAEAAQSSAISGVHLRFAGAGETHKVSGRIVLGHTFKVEPVNLPATAFSTSADGTAVEFAFDTAKDAVVGMDLVAPPAGAQVAWALYWDDAPWPDHHVFGGPFGLESVSLTHGIASDEARAAAAGSHVAEIDSQRDSGLFVTIDDVSGGGHFMNAPARSKNGAAASEMNQMLRQWGYAH